MTGSKTAEYEKCYQLLGVNPGATEKDVTSAYRSKALKLHPDKNPDDPIAQERFHELQKAYQVLLDPEARQAYDQILRLRKERAERQNKLDSKRKMMQEELLERERSAKRQALDAETQLQARMEKLRKESTKRDQNHHSSTESEGSSKTLIIETSLDSEGLSKLLYPYDDRFKILSTTDPFHVEFSSTLSAELVHQLCHSNGLPLKCSWLEKRKQTLPKVVKPSLVGTDKVKPITGVQLQELENKTLQRLREAQARKESNK